MSQNMRKLVAFAAHAPGLWLFYREKLSAPLKRANAAALFATLVAMILAGVLLPKESALAAVALAWGIGHVAWGLYLAARLPE